MSKRNNEYLLLDIKESINRIIIYTEGNAILRCANIS